VIWVPLGDEEDQTRSMSDMDRLADYLVDCGAQPWAVGHWLISSITSRIRMVSVRHAVHPVWSSADAGTPADCAGRQYPGHRPPVQFVQLARNACR
jgi:hypothetical protein